MAKLELNAEEQKVIEESIGQIRKVLRSKNADITKVLGMVTMDDVKSTKRAVEVRFQEDVDLSVQMNMVAFD